MSNMITKRDYLILYALLALIYIFGLFIPLMENDAAQHAVTSMRIYLDNDFLHLLKDGEDYLDKPHLHFWLAALSYKIFGISHWAYRLPSLMFTLLAAYSCYKLAKHFYGELAAHPAALIFLSSQAIFLANHDVRTDAVLTGAVIFGIWQLVLYIDSGKLIHVIGGAFGIGLAFSAKGQLGVFVPGVCILAYLLYSRKWHSVLSWKVLLGIGVFAITIAPVLYAYYVQFDLHPEKEFNGKTGVSGVKFILWDQSFNRLTAKGFDGEKTVDYSFFFTNLLWAFLPWSILMYSALANRLKQFFKLKFKKVAGLEALTSIGILVVLIVMSFSKFKLPHYLNSLIPVLAVLVSGYLTYLYIQKKEKATQVFLAINYVVLALGIGLVLFMTFWAFPKPHFILILADLGFLIGLVYLLNIPMTKMRRLLVFSVYMMILANFCLNTQFYPSLLNYQEGNTAVKIMDAENISYDKIYRLDGDRNSWSLDFYTAQIVPKIALEDYENLPDDSWLFLYDNEFEAFKEQGLTFEKKYEIVHYRITQLRIKFLNPNTRDQVLERAYLIKK